MFKRPWSVYSFYIWEVSFDHRITPTARFIRGCLILFNIDDCIYRGRTLDSGIGSFRLNPQLGRQLHSSTSGVNASKKIRWIGHCLEDPTLKFEAPGTPLHGIIKNWTNEDVVHSAIYEALIAHHLVYRAHQLEEMQHTRCAPANHHRPSGCSTLYNAGVH